MLEYDRTDILEGIDVNKTNTSKESDICHFWYFKDIGFKYEPDLSYGCHDLKQKAINFNDVAIVYVKGSASWVYFWYMRKIDAISIMNNSNLFDKKGVFNFFITLLKMNVSVEESNYKKKQGSDTK